MIACLIKFFVLGSIWPSEILWSSTTVPQCHLSTLLSATPVLSANKCRLLHPGPGWRIHPMLQTTSPATNNDHINSISDGINDDSSVATEAWQQQQITWKRSFPAKCSEIVVEIDNVDIHLRWKAMVGSCWRLVTIHPKLKQEAGIYDWLITHTKQVSDSEKVWHAAIL